MKVNSYARVSTDDKEQDPERQLIKLRSYAEIHEHTIMKEIVDYDTGDSDPFKREQGKRLLDNNPDGILFFSMDRFTRQHPIKVFNMMNDMRNQNVKLVSITEPLFNMESEFAEVMIFLLTWWNNYFLKKLKRDIKSGMDRARLDGKQIGRTPATFNKEIAYRLLFEEKKSQRKVAKLLNTSLATVNRFKKGIEKKGGLYISEHDVTKRNVLEHVKEGLKK